MLAGLIKFFIIFTIIIITCYHLVSFSPSLSSLLPFPQSSSPIASSYLSLPPSLLFIVSSSSSSSFFLLFSLHYLHLYIINNSPDSSFIIYCQKSLYLSCSSYSLINSLFSSYLSPLPA